MTKREFVNYLSEKYPQITRKDMELVVNTILDAMIEAFEREERIDIRDFGNFVVKRRRPRKARNPRTGAEVDLPERRKVHFKVGKGLFRMLNEK